MTAHCLKRGLNLPYCEKVNGSPGHWSLTSGRMKSVWFECLESRQGLPTVPAPTGYPCAVKHPHLAECSVLSCPLPAPPSLAYALLSTDFTLLKFFFTLETERPLRDRDSCTVYSQSRAQILPWDSLPVFADLTWVQRNSWYDRGIYEVSGWANHKNPERLEEEGVNMEGEKSSRGKEMTTETEAITQSRLLDEVLMKSQGRTMTLFFSTVSWGKCHVTCGQKQ